MYLSRLILNPHSRQVQRELSDRYQLHRTVMSAFPLHIPSGERVLFRVDENLDGHIQVLVQSQTRPDWSKLNKEGKDYLLPEDALATGMLNLAMKELDLIITPGINYNFRLQANPTIKKKPHPNEESKRTGIYKEAEQVAWLKRKLALAGCQLVTVRTSNLQKMKTSLIREEDKHQLTFAAVQFDGVLRVEDASLVMNAITQGIGSAKGLGYGLLSLAPENNYA